MSEPAAAPARRLRVVVSAPGHMLGGQAQAASAIVSGFRSDPSVDAELVPIDPRLGGRARRLTEWPLIRSVVRPWLYLRALRRAAPRADVFHVFCAAHTAFLFGAVPAVWVARRFGVPVVLNYHDGRAAAHFRWWGPVVRWAARRAAVLVFPSAYLQRLFRSHGLDGVVVPNVVDTSAFAWRRPERVRPRLVSARLLEPLYAVENTLRAFALVRAAVPDAVLDIYGAGRSERSLRRLAARLGGRGITFHGAVPHRSMPEVFGAGGVLVNSSRIDNMPHVLIEAMAAGLPIVTTAAGGIPDMVTTEKTALLVPIDDPPGLAAAVLRVLNDDGLAGRLADAGREECRRYSWETAADLWRATYRRVARLPAPAPLAVPAEPVRTSAWERT